MANQYAGGLRAAFWFQFFDHEIEEDPLVVLPKAESRMVCPRCGRRYKMNRHTCPNCGGKLNKREVMITK